MTYLEELTEHLPGLPSLQAGRGLQARGQTLHFTQKQRVEGGAVVLVCPSAALPVPCLFHYVVAHAFQPAHNERGKQGKEETSWERAENALPADFFSQVVANTLAFGVGAPGSFLPTALSSLHFDSRMMSGYSHLFAELAFYS